MKVLLADDEKTIAVTLGDALRDASHDVTVVSDGEQALEAVRREPFDCVITDIRMPKLDGLEVVEALRKIQPQCKVILITAYANVAEAVAAIKGGAEDYLQKPFFNEDVLAKLKRMERVMTLERENQELRERLSERHGLGAIVGKSRPMQAVYDLVRSVAPSDASLLIEGESGTGKELVAEAIHECSARRQGPFVEMSCGVYPEGLIEDELFGHVKGAYTDARSDKAGRFERAHGGTIFIDDVDDLQPALQVKLLRVLQEREVDRIGGTRAIKVDVRVVTATKKDLWDLVQAGRFREDLFHRLHVIQIKLPPLRDRLEDIPLLVEHFTVKHGGGRAYHVLPEAMEALQGYGWPGNVRELEHAVERAIVLAGPDGTLRKEHLLRPLLQAPEAAAAGGGPPGPLCDVLAKAEAGHIRAALAFTQGQRGEAAKLLGIGRKSLWEKMREYGIEG